MIYWTDAKCSASSCTSLQVVVVVVCQRKQRKNKDIVLGVASFASLAWQEYVEDVALRALHALRWLETRVS